MKGKISENVTNILSETDARDEFRRIMGQTSSLNQGKHGIVTTSDGTQYEVMNLREALRRKRENKEN